MLSYFPRPSFDRPVAHHSAYHRALALRRRRFPFCCRSRRCRRLTFPTIAVARGPARRQPGNHGFLRATPLERQFGRIAGVTEMTSTSGFGSTSITLQFDLNRDIDAAARDVQAAINAARSQLPANLPSNPSIAR